MTLVRGVPALRYAQIVGRSAVAGAVAAILVACESGNGQRLGPSLDIGADTLGRVPAARAIPVRTRRTLVENSGATMSRAQPGVWFTINDSGNDPILYALDTAGADRGAWRIAGARNRDWEALTLGSCVGRGMGTASDGAGHCVYIGEVGDNGAQHPSLTIYRVEEPPAASRGFNGALNAVALHFTYEGGARDVEAMYAGPDGSLYFISKRPLKDPTGRLRPALVFALPAAAWDRPESLATAAVIDSLPIVPGSALGRQVTGADRAPDGSAVAIRTYTQLYVFRADAASGRIITSIPPTICSIAGLEEQQGEGIAWFGDRGEWLLTSEGRNEPLWVVDCPAPLPD